MDLAIITSGFYEGSVSVTVTCNVANGTLILMYDDESKDLIGSSTITDATTNVAISPALYVGQRIIAYVTSFGNKTYGSVIVTESDTENTGWEVPETVDSIPYIDYLSSGGKRLPDLYDPAHCRNASRDMDAINRAIESPISFRLRQIESQGGTIQIVIEDITGAIGGFKTRFDADSVGTTTTKTYSANGTFQVKVWSADKLEVTAITKIYNLTMPTATIDFGTTVMDLSYQADYGQLSSPGTRPIRIWVYAVVPVECKIDGVTSWEVCSNDGSRYTGPVHFLAEGEYTIRCRKLSDGSQELVRQIKLDNF